MAIKEDCEREAADIIVDLVCQYAYTRNEEDYFSDGLSVMENAFIWLVRHGYAIGSASHIKLADKAENKEKTGDKLDGDLYTNYEGKEGE